MRRLVLASVVALVSLLSVGPRWAAADVIVTAPANITQSNDPNQAGAVVNYPAPTTQFSGADSGGTTTCSPPSGAFYPVGTTTVTCTATGNGGGTGSASFTITVNDTQPPSITVPANITVGNNPNQAGAVVNYPAPTASDNAPGVTAVCVPPSGSFLPVGTTTVTCTATDTAGNTATASFTITVNDTQPPNIGVPGDVEDTTDPGEATAEVTYAPPAASDNVPGVTVACVPASGTDFAIGDTEVTCTATDTAGNTSTSSFTVTVDDDEDPEIDLGDVVPLSLVAPAGASGAAATFPTPGADDNSGQVTVACTPASGSTFPVGTTTVLCTATDPSGNVDVATFTVAVAAAQVGGTGTTATTARSTSSLARTGVTTSGQGTFAVGSVLVGVGLVLVAKVPALRPRRLRRATD